MKYLTVFHHNGVTSFGLVHDSADTSFMKGEVYKDCVGLLPILEPGETAQWVGEDKPKPAPEPYPDRKTGYGWATGKITKERCLVFVDACGLVSFMGYSHRMPVEKFLNNFTIQYLEDQ